MISKISEDYTLNIDFLRDITGDKKVILSHITALEYLKLLNGCVNKKEINVYSLSKGKNKNFNYHIVNTFDGIEYETDGKILYTTINQTINDMLFDFENTNVQCLIEALSNYYHLHEDSFDGLVINPKNIKIFKTVKEWASEYYKFK